MFAAGIIVAFLLVNSSFASILMPNNFYSPETYSNDINAIPMATVDQMDKAGEDATKVQQEHTRNCFFTPVQCMLPLTDSHKDVRSLHGVYEPSANQVRRSVDTMLTSPWGYTDLMKRSDDRFYRWLNRF